MQTNFFNTLLNLGLCEDNSIQRKEKEKIEDALQFQAEKANSTTPDTVDSFLAKFLSMAALKNPHQTKMYIPLDMLMNIFIKKFSDIPDLDSTLRNNFSSKVEEKKEALIISKETPLEETLPTENFDIITYRDLIFWEPGKTIHPSIEKSIENLKSFVEKGKERITDVLEKKSFNDGKEKIRFLIEASESFSLKRSFWTYVENNIEDPKIFKTFALLFRINVEEISLHRLFTSLLNNMELLENFICSIRI